MIGYTILSKNICVNKNQNHDANAVAIGLPIKNVFPQYNDTTISKTTKDGKFVVTQLIKHDTENIFDIYYEYTAKDENSPIESISVTSKPFTTSIADELDKWGALLPETKNTILAFNLTEKLPELGTFQSLSGMGRQITLHFDSGDYYFQTYKSDNDTEYIMLIKFDYSNGADPESAKWWLHHGDKFTSIELPLPKRPYNDANYQLHIGDDGISYDNMEEKDFRSYPWNGNYFDNDYDDEENNTSQNNSNTYSQYATGDLNGDNLKDSVAYDDGLSVFWGTDNGQYKLFKKYKVLKPEEGTYNKSAEIKDGNLVLKTRYQCDGFMNYDYIGLPVDDMLAMGIFRRMQADDMMHWALCDYESGYGRALQSEGEDDDRWNAYGSYESLGSYNMDNDLTIIKLNDNTYSIVINETSEDRSYESQLNEDASNIDDLDILEAETSTSKLTFNDGKFIEQK
jgi:hypothetical protein